MEKTHGQKVVESLNILTTYRHNAKWNIWQKIYLYDKKLPMDTKIEFDCVLEYICQCLCLNFSQVLQSCINGVSDDSEKSKIAFIKRYLNNYFWFLESEKLEQHLFLQFTAKGKQSELFFAKGTTMGDVWTKAEAFMAYTGTTFSQIESTIVTDCIWIKMNGTNL